MHNMHMSHVQHVHVHAQDAHVHVHMCMCMHMCIGDASNSCCKLAVLFVSLVACGRIGRIGY